MSSRAADQRTSDFVEQFAVLLEAEGLPRVAGRLFGLLLVSAEPRSLEDVANQLNVSKASVSINARHLEEKGVVERVGRQADRRDYYQIADNLVERMLEQRIAKVRRLQQSIAGARKTCIIGNQVVCARLDRIVRSYEHLVETSARALADIRDLNDKRPTGASRSR